MPTILRIGPYRFFFYSGDGEEPAHVHVERDEKVAKFWVNPTCLNNSGGFSRVELLKIQKIVSENETQIVEAWHDYFGN